ncbi:UDP-N-acetylglucosamine 2-epimerase (non-hydrolysing) [Lacibacter cauensis]|uniref:UDP-N-acetylglucosamine 2-epimerase (non-hydrolyzing) n=1 Tax=Lacibacter cauensis TaxID=510947 RepID=A0A562SL15_9BACT|nr:UDP-N-acetylglucosamine 2-epimerase (non-hydrolyzing) [Lacibacter cauensis]TWI81420.1 UDP-N-acetylglucosamine 2-epimerase (non-hydrolysing) [Lacibacter cauensis]
MALTKKILVVFGTRPEAIKFAPLIKRLQQDPMFDLTVCITSQHKEMLQQVLSFFAIRADVDLDVMQPNQNLSTLTSVILSKLSPVIAEKKPDLVIVQGDTTTAFAGALAAFYQKVPVAHLEAGLRSNNIYSPFPEEINRKLIGTIAALHFVPTDRARTNLQAEGIAQHVYLTGNTVVDALFMGLKIIEERALDFRDAFSFCKSGERVVLVTGHRRESFGDGFDNICKAITYLAHRFPAVQIVYPVHLNPNVQEPVYRMLGSIKNVHLIPPVSYEQMIWLLQQSYLVLTDSGGVQEEAPSLGKPVLVMRDVTEREEGILAGTAKLVGTSSEMIIEQTSRLLEDADSYERMSKSVNPYGDGTASEQIADLLTRYFTHEA